MTRRLVVEAALAPATDSAATLRATVAGRTGRAGVDAVVGAAVDAQAGR